MNPQQFAPDEDFDAYPRTLNNDIALATAHGADFMFAPRVQDVFPDKTIDVPLPRVAHEPRLEDLHRPTHFQGVCNVVARLFDMVKQSKLSLEKKITTVTCHS